MFGNLFGNRQNEPRPRHPGLPTPLNLRPGGMVQFDAILSRVLGQTGKYTLEFPEPGKMHRIQSQGECDLGQGAKLSRFYLQDDYWLQVKWTGGTADADIVPDEVHLFGFGDVFTPANQQEFEDFAAGFGLATFSYDDKTWDRVWSPGSRKAAAAEYPERVYPADDAAYGAQHQDMLYSREIPGGREEFLLVSIETGDNGDVNVVHSVGIPLNISDFQAT
ncbi:MAG TPA: DUF2491 family protein [Fibrobacteria bacterium]|nr:DUF2491 family protein [Fibrobacteria bacterium]HOX52981.1 DUF2491 family protein [Fibrobacteria bacterium]